MQATIKASHSGFHLLFPQDGHTVTSTYLSVYYVPQQLEVKLQTDAFILVGVDKIFKLEIKPWTFMHVVSYRLGQSKYFLWVQSMLVSFQINI